MHQALLGAIIIQVFVLVVGDAAAPFGSGELWAGGCHLKLITPNFVIIATVGSDATPVLFLFELMHDSR